MAVNPVRVLGRTVHLWLALAVLTVGGCGGGGKDSTPTPPATVVIQGIVTDDPVERATVTLTALADNTVFATTVTGIGGTPTSPAIMESTVSRHHLIAAVGGTPLGRNFFGTLSAARLVPASHTRVPITVPTAAVPLPTALGSPTNTPPLETSWQTDRSDAGVNDLDVAANDS